MGYIDVWKLQSGDIINDTECLRFAKKLEDFSKILEDFFKN